MAAPRISVWSVTGSHTVVCAQLTLLAAFLLFSPACGRSSSAANLPPPEKPVAQPNREVRATGTVQAVRSFVVQTPYIAGQGGQLTLTHLVENGIKVKEGDLL